VSTRSDSPDDWASDAPPLRVAVERSPRTGIWKIDPRIRVESVVVGSNDLLSGATLGVYAGPVWPRTYAEEDALSAADVLNGERREGWGATGRFLRPDQELLIFLDRDPTASTPIAGDRQVLLRGMCGNPRYDEHTDKTTSSGHPNSERLFTLNVQGMFERLSDMPHAQIYGRYVRSAVSQASLDAEFGHRQTTTAFGTLASTVDLVRAMSCVFNPGGRPNRSAAPVTYGEANHAVHLFCDEDDPDAQPWTFAQALRHLAAIYVFGAVAAQGGVAPGPITDGNVFSSTDSLVGLTSADRPTVPVSDADAWKYAMLGEPRDLICDGLNVCEALVLLADMAGVRFRVADEEVLDNSSAVSTNWRRVLRSRLYFQARGCGPHKKIKKDARRPIAGRLAKTLLGRCNVNELTIEVDYRDTVSDAVFVGGVRRYEVTVELVPGWQPDSHLDNIEGDEAIDAAIEYAELHWDMTEPGELAADPWYQRYHVAGSSFASYAQVGRRWVLNATNLYHPASYGRDVGPFDADAYAPWQPSDAEIWDDLILPNGSIGSAPVLAGDWVFRPRPFQPCFSADAEFESLGIVVEFSFDAGSTWSRIGSAKIVNLEDDTGIYINHDDLTELLMDGEGDDQSHFWAAIIRQQARVRVTAVIEGDDRITAAMIANHFTPGTPLSTGRVFDASHKYASHRRDNANSQFGPAGSRPAPAQTLETRNDLAALKHAAETLYEIVSSRQCAIAAAIPWVEAAEYAVLDSVQEITGIGMKIWSHGSGRTQRWTDIVAIQYWPGGTRLLFEDPRLAEELMGEMV